MNEKLILPFFFMSSVTKIYAKAKKDMKEKYKGGEVER